MTGWYNTDYTDLESSEFESIDFMQNWFAIFDPILLQKGDETVLWVSYSKYVLYVKP